MSVKRYSVWDDEMFEEKHALNATNGMVHLVVKYEDYSSLEKKLTDMAVQLANAESKCRELAAENAALKVSAIFLADEAVQIYKRWNLTQQPDGDIVDMQTIHETICACHETPATDAYLAEVRAQGVEMLAAKYESKIEPYKNHDEFMNAHYLKMQAIEWQRTTDDVLFAKVIADFEDQYQADAVFIDYGYGTGLKSVGDNWGRNWTLIMFGSGTADPEMGNKRGEMYKSARDALKLGAQLDSQELADELSAPEYKVRLKDSRKILQDKDEVKELLGRSPNNADAYVLTYAAPVTKKQFNYGQQQSQQGKALTEYDPYA